MKKFLLILCALFLTVLPALAEDAPVFSENLLLMQTANSALFDRYGLTAPCLGLFDMEITHYGDAAILRYLPRTRPHPSLTGEYVVLITPEDVHALWTHDDVDPALWQSGDLNSPAWGVKQLTAYLLESSFTREYFDEPYIPREQPDPYWPGGSVLLYRAGDLTEEEAAIPSALARAAVQVMYGLTEEAAAEMHTIEIALITYKDGRREWDVSLYHNAEPDETNYDILIDADTQVILEMSIFNGGIG